MITDTLENAGRYASLHPLFEGAFKFVRQANLQSLEPGRHEIDGDNVFAIVVEGPAKPKAEAPLEIHRKYVDIQIIVDGIDEMGWKDASLCKFPDGEFDEEKDLQFFKDEPEFYVPVMPGMFAVFFPEDAHAPMSGKGNIRKVVVKVAV